VSVAEDGAALADDATATAPPPRAKPREPAITVEAASFLMVLMVVMPINVWPHVHPYIGRNMRLAEALWVKRCRPRP